MVFKITQMTNNKGFYMRNLFRILISSFSFAIATVYKTRLRHCCLSVFLLAISSLTFAQPQLVTPQLIDQYNLDFSDPVPDPIPYELVVGSNGALYLRDNSNGSSRKISQRMNGVPAAVVTRTSGSGEATYYQADKNFEHIVYVSKDPNITPGDSGDSEDVFVYSVSEDKTIRIQGNKPHEGLIGEVRINAEGDTVAFGSWDWYFGDTTNIDITGNTIDDFNGNAGLVYLAKIMDFDSGASLPFTAKYRAFADRFGGITISWLCTSDCQFLGNSILFAISFSNSLYAGKTIYDYDSSDETLTAVAGDYFDERSSNEYSADILDDQRHILLETNLTEFTDFFGINDAFVYDSRLNDKFAFTEDFPTVTHNGFSFSDSFIKVSGALSKNSRFVTFHAKKLDDISGDDQHSEYNTGRIYVYDIWTGDIKPAFSVNRTALSFGFYDTNLGSLSKTTCINCDGIDDYEIEPSDIRFHDNDQYITFEANSWYLDPTVPYSSFAVPYARDVFVVANPFNSDEDQASCGVPDTTVDAGGGIYLWRDCDTGQWRLQVIGSETLQNLAGVISSDQGINNILAENLETVDQYTSASDKLDFNLDTRSGDEDGFSFYLSELEGSCINIANAETVNVRIGARQIELAVPFDLKTLAPVNNCGDDTIAVDGAPSIDQSTDQGWYIWRENSAWQSRFVAGGTTLRFKGLMESSEPMSDLQPVSIEANDLLELNPSTILNFNLYVRGPYRDGFNITIPNSADTCVRLSSPSTAAIYLGPNKVIMPNAFNLSTLAACEVVPDIETLGRPVINSTVDNGIFLWEISTHL